MLYKQTKNTKLTHRVSLDKGTHALDFAEIAGRAATPCGDSLEVEEGAAKGAQTVVLAVQHLPRLSVPLATTVACVSCDCMQLRATLVFVRGGCVGQRT